jgi:hypothetical protein
MGMDGERAKAYAQDLAIATVVPQELDFVRTLQSEFRAQGIYVRDRDIRAVAQQQRKLAERKVMMRFWVPNSNGQVMWERRLWQRVRVAPLRLPLVLQGWQQRHAEMI